MAARQNGGAAPTLNRLGRRRECETEFPDGARPRTDNPNNFNAIGATSSKESILSAVVQGVQTRERPDMEIRPFRRIPALSVAGLTATMSYLVAPAVVFVRLFGGFGQLGRRELGLSGRNASQGRKEPFEAW